MNKKAKDPILFSLFMMLSEKNFWIYLERFNGD